jgi:UDP-N-acetylmuramoyl-L-alanyl-D-glutamate--2,6-diaminopimelate ligase
MSCFIADLLKDWPCTWIQGTYSQPIFGIKDDSRKIKKGDLFVAINGRKDKGKHYIDEAIQKGAICIITEDKVTDLLNPTIAYATVPNTKTFLSHACSRFYGNPSEKLHVIAVTGTNGKTTVSHLIGQLLYSQGIQVAVIGTLGLFINGKKINEIHSHLTTWSAIELHQTLAYCVKKHVTHVVLEASSMGLAQHRLDFCSIDQGVFLNLGHDHLEDHAGFEAYGNSKRQLMKLCKQIVANEDDEFWNEHAKNSGKPVEWFNRNQIELVEMKSRQMLIRLKGDRTIIPIQFTGMFNVANLSAALMTLDQIGFSAHQLKPFLSYLSLPNGRLQRIEGKHCEVFIDYAHTPEALQQVLESLRDIVKGRLVLVFGCGGDRDQEKRPEMGRIANTYADKVFITSDNPRSENPVEICHDIIKDLTNISTIHVELDRKEAIEKALQLANDLDTVLIAGKGHETTQQIGSNIIPLSDEQIVKEFLISRNDKERTGSDC